MCENQSDKTACFEGRIVTNGSSSAEKIALFRALFRGREDVYARRWENPKTGKCGYSPACVVEWIRGVCGKAGGKANCATCPTRQFRPLDDAAIEAHLRGCDAAGKHFVLGSYPLLAEDVLERIDEVMSVVNDCVEMLASV